jgi:hypothetical protein
MLRRRQLQAAVGAVIVAVGLGASALGASASSGVTQANASAMPAFNLVTGSTTWVSGSGFPKSTTVAIVQCNSKVATQGQKACDISHPIITHSTVTGRVAARAYKVVEGTIGSGTGTGMCDDTHSCFMVIATLDMSTAGLATIHFA